MPILGMVIQIVSIVVMLAPHAAVWTTSSSAQDRTPTTLHGQQPPGSTASALPGALAPRAFSIHEERGVYWLVKPDGERFFSLGVNCVGMGASRQEYNPHNPGYAAWQHYPDSTHWAEDTLKRLRTWGFTTVGGWSDYQSLRQFHDKNVSFAAVLHIGSTAGAPWRDMWDPKVIERMDEVARDQILALRDDTRVIGYYSDNEMGWWHAPLFRMTLEMPPSSHQRQVLIALLEETYGNDWAELLKDFEPEGINSFAELKRRGMLYVRPGGTAILTIQRFTEKMADRYYSLVRDIIRKYDKRALVLGDRYQSFFYPEVARASSPYVDIVSTNLNAPWNDGTFPRFYLDTLHGLTGKPILVSEFYMAAQQNRSGNQNSSSGFPVVTTQEERAAGFRRSLQSLLKAPYVVGADWFQYYDEPTLGREDGENYNFGLVDIHDRPYESLTKASSALDLVGLKSQAAGVRPDALQGVPPAPHDPLGRFKVNLALVEWDRERGFVKPLSQLPMADLYVSWNEDAIYLGLYAQDVVEDAYYRGKTVPESDRAAWSITVGGSTIQARIGAGLKPVVADPSLRIVNTSGVNHGVRNIAAIELPARLFGKTRFHCGDTIELASRFDAYSRAYRVEWKGGFTLAANRAGPRRHRTRATGK